MKPTTGTTGTKVTRDTKGTKSTTQRIVVSFVSFVMIAFGLAADADAQDSIDPDRPDVTNGTHIVDAGLMQLEMGGQFLHAGDQRLFGSPFTARIGLTDWLEARIGTDGFVTQTDGIVRQSGVGNTNIGAKLRLWADPGGVPVLSILPAVNLPTGDPDKGLGSGDRDYLLAVLTGSDIGRHWHADVNYGIGAIGAGNGESHFVQHLASISVSVAATDNLNPYVEAYWLSKQDARGPSVSAIDAGAIYELGPRYAVDGGVGVTVSGGRGVSLFGGVSMVVGDILGAHVEAARERRRQRRLAKQ